MKFEDREIGSVEKIEFLQQQLQNTLEAILPLSTRKTKKLDIECSKTQIIEIYQNQKNLEETNKNRNSKLSESKKRYQ